MSMTENEILEFLAENPRSIASEIGATSVEMIRLEKKEKVSRVGSRETGNRGRPPVEWAVHGSDLPVVEKVEGGGFPKGMPRLPNIDAIRPYLSAEHTTQVKFIEDTFRGVRVLKGVEHPLYREVGDYRPLLVRYRQIVRSTKAPVKIEMEPIDFDGE